MESNETGHPSRLILCICWVHMTDVIVFRVHDLEGTWMDRWCDFKYFSTVFQSYQYNSRAIIKGCIQWNIVYS